jgi:hypothetical protein
MYTLRVLGGDIHSVPIMPSDAECATDLKAKKLSTEKQLSPSLITNTVKERGGWFQYLSQKDHNSYHCCMGYLGSLVRKGAAETANKPTHGPVRGSCLRTRVEPCPHTLRYKDQAKKQPAEATSPWLL